MAKKKNSGSVVSLKALCEKAGIKHHKVYNFLVGKYRTLDYTEKTQLVNTFHDEVSPLLKELGFFIQLKRIKDPDPAD